MYLVKALGEAKAVDISGKEVNWAVNQTGLVPDDQIAHFQNNPAAWEVLAGPSFNSIIAYVSVNNPGEVPEVDGIEAIHNGLGVVNQTVLILDGVAIDVAKDDAYASAKIYEFPAGRILVLGVLASLQWGVTTPRDDTINDSADLSWAIGSAEASSDTLSDAMVDLIPKTSVTLEAEDSDLNETSNAALAESAQFDGTSSALGAYLNVGFETGDDIDDDGTLEATGSVTITWVNLGNF